MVEENHECTHGVLSGEESGHEPRDAPATTFIASRRRHARIDSTCILHDERPFLGAKMAIEVTALAAAAASSLFYYTTSTISSSSSSTSSARLDSVRLRLDAYFARRTTVGASSPFSLR